MRVAAGAGSTPTKFDPCHLNRKSRDNPNLHHLLSGVAVKDEEPRIEQWSRHVCVCRPMFVKKESVEEETSSIVMVVVLLYSDKKDKRKEKIDQSIER